MNKHNKHKLVPRLRFPEFVGDGLWENNELSFLAENLDSKRVPITSNQREKGEVPYYGASGIIDYVKGYIYDENLLCISEDGANLIDRNYPIAFSISGKSWVNNHVHVLKFKSIYTQLLVEKYINSINIEGFLTGMAQPKLNRSKLDIISIPLPKNPNEQQKIATCLSSLDDVLSAERQKLEVLKEHKKGLLQNLLPQEGEAVPKFRFKEFKESGEWTFDTFSEYIKLYRGSSPRPIQNYLTTEESGVNWIKIGDTKYSDNFMIKRVEEKITLEGAKSSRKVKIGELILANSMSYGKSYLLLIGGYIYDGWFVLREYENHFDKNFLLQLLNSDYMQNQYKKLSAGGIVQNISSDIVYNTILPHTSITEQKKIANCLASLDEIISGQNQKIEALQLHKKGLLQGLFPNINETEA